MRILQDVYGGGCAPGESLERLPKELSNKRWAFFDEVEKAMGLEFIERHWDGLMEANLYRDYTNFREGFRLGVSLMLELLEPRESAKAGRQRTFPLREKYAPVPAPWADKAPSPAGGHRKSRRRDPPPG